MTVEEFVVQKPKSFDVSHDGTRFRLGFTCQDGDEVCLTLPTECLNTLIMTLPTLMRLALRVRRHDDSLRLVYPAGKITIERASDSRVLVVTFATPDGFEVSFGLTRQQLEVFDPAAIDEQGTYVKGVDFN